MPIYSINSLDAIWLIQNLFATLRLLFKHRRDSLIHWLAQSPFTVWAIVKFQFLGRHFFVLEDKLKILTYLDSFYAQLNPSMLSSVKKIHLTIHIWLNRSFYTPNMYVWSIFYFYVQKFIVASIWGSSWYIYWMIKTYNGLLTTNRKKCLTDLLW